jgi:lantibiotic modifying enzyme
MNSPSTYLIQEKLLEITNEVRRNNCENTGLLVGHCGITIFLAYVNQLYDDPELTIQMENSLQKSLEIFKLDGAAHSFCSGYAGVCWGVNHLVANGKLDTDVNDLFEEIEPYLTITSENDFQKNLFDFLHGGIGAGIYFLERLPNPIATQHLRKIVYYLEAQKLESGIGIRWMNSFMKLDKQSRETEFNLGIAHGIPSIIYFLSKCYEKNIENEKCAYLLENSINWIIEQRINTKSLSLYPAVVKDNVENKNHSRLAWCYGDLGIAIAIWQAGKALNRQSWKEEAVFIMLHASKRKELDANSVIDAGICHGTAGIAQFFNRFYWETKDPVFKETANYWIDQTLKMARFEGGLAGYKVWRGNDEGWVNDYGLLEGLSGIGLVLYSYISETEPIWDRCLLFS